MNGIPFDKISCPYCHSKKYEVNLEKSDKLYIEDLYEEEKAVCICSKCKKHFLVINKNDALFERFVVEEMLQPEDYIRDCPGQLFFWEDLNPGGIRIF